MVFDLFEFGRGLLAFLISLLWTVMLYYKARPKTMMMTSCIIVIITGIAVFFIVPKNQKVGDEDTQIHTTEEAIKGVAYVAKLPVVWIAGINVFCIYGAFVAAGTYFARFLQGGYGTSAVAAAVFATVVIALRMLLLVSSFLVEKVFESSAHFMRTMQIILVVILTIIGGVFFTNHPDISLYTDGYLPDQAPTGLISSGMFWTLVVLMLLASACIFMIRGVYYAPIGELGVTKKHSSAAMSSAITIGYIPALLAPIVLGGLVKSPDKDATGQIIRSYLTDTQILGTSFLGLAVLALISVFMSHTLIKLKQCQQLKNDAGVGINWMNNQNIMGNQWIAQCNQEDSITTLLIPGTHDTMTSDYNDRYYRTQALSLVEQLQIGVRFLDIRLCKEMVVAHREWISDIQAEQIFEMCGEFLYRNPTEFILMRIQNANESKDDFAEYGEALISKILKYRNIFYQWNEVETDEQSNPYWPTIMHAAGKIVPLEYSPAHIQLNKYNQKLWAANWHSNPIFCYKICGIVLV